MLGTPDSNGRGEVNWAHWIAGQAGVVPISLDDNENDTSGPGSAKTASHKAFARKINVPYIAQYCSRDVPEDFKGIPKPGSAMIGGEERECAKFLLEEGMLRATIEPCVVHIDEITCTDEQVQAAALEWINNPPEGCLMFSTGNQPDVAANGTQLADTTVNRCCMLLWEFDREAWAKGMTDGGGFDFPAPEAPLLPQDWRDGVGTYSRLVNTYVNSTDTQFSRPENLLKFPKDEEKRGKPFPSPRSWTNLAKLLGAADSVGASRQVKMKLGAGCVGPSFSDNFFTFMDAENYYIDPEDILKNPESFVLPGRGDLDMLFVDSILRCIKNNLTPQRWERGREFLAVVYKQASELAQMRLGVLWKLKPEGHEPEEKANCAVMESQVS